MNFGTSIRIVISVIIVIIVSNFFRIVISVIIIIIIMSNFYIRNTSLHLSKSKKCLKTTLEIFNLHRQSCAYLLYFKQATYDFIHCFCHMNTLFCFIKTHPLCNPNYNTMLRFRSGGISQVNGGVRSREWRRGVSMVSI